MTMDDKTEKLFLEIMKLDESDQDLILRALLSSLQEDLEYYRERAEEVHSEYK